MSQSAFTPEEEAFRDQVREVANSGDLHSAMLLARQFHKTHPTSYTARYYVAVETGDYAEDAEIDEDERARLRAFAIAELHALHNDPHLPEVFKYSVANEVFWFTRQHEAQYNLGVERVASGNIGGHYSKCVGASDQAKKLLLEDRNLAVACEWAKRSLEAFREYEKHNATWSNINPFAAIAAAILGDHDGAVALFTDMFRKQGKPVEKLRVESFKEKIVSIERVRSELSSK